jgi:cell wall-associated NlpC family hydrolase
MGKFYRGDVMPGRLTLTALRGALLFPLLVPSLIGTAHADVYHAVAAGETLASVAAKYRISPDQLRAANSLTDADSTPLGAMLLRVPGADDKSAAIIAPRINSSAEVSVNFGDNAYTSGRTASGNGIIAKTMVETVRAGDTWDSIANRYRAAGNDVTVQSLRQRNAWADLPAPGNTVIVPLGQVAYSAPQNTYAQRVAAAANRPTYTASAQTNPDANVPVISGPNRNSSAGGPRNLGGGVLASGEVDLPFAQDNTPTQPPVFGASAPQAPRRGNLPSRGGYGQLARNTMGGEVRVLSPGEDASAPPAASQPRVTVNRTATVATSIAHVAKVSSADARIRRLPQASAVTLYNCKPGTQLAVLKQSGIWSAVLMSDRSTGWLPTKYLSMTQQTVDVSAQVTQTDPGGQVNGFAGNYAGENPMVAAALKWLGTPYLYGGTGRRGIDCSSLVQTAFRSCGYKLPRTAAQQATVGVAVAPAQLKAGDRLYFSASGTRIDHTGLYMGDGLFVHASGSGRHVMVSNLFTPRNWNIFVGARR